MFDVFDNMSTVILTQIHRIFVHFSLFWHRVSFFLFSLIKIITIRRKFYVEMKRENFGKWLESRDKKLWQKRWA